jgi:hypothetical protein
LSQCALLALLNPFNAGLPIDIAASLSAHSALAFDGVLRIAGPAMAAASTSPEG